MDVEVNKDNYHQVVVAPGIPTVVEFWGPRCHRCFALMPVIERIVEEFGEPLRLIKVDASKNRRLCLNLKLLGLPSFLFYRNGREVKRLAGEQVSAGDLRQAVAEASAE